MQILPETLSNRKNHAPENLATSGVWEFVDLPKGPNTEEVINDFEKLWLEAEEAERKSAQLQPITLDLQ